MFTTAVNYMAYMRILLMTIFSYYFSYRKRTWEFFYKGFASLQFGFFENKTTRYHI